MMRRILYLLLLAVGSVMMLQAQTRIPREVHVGLIGGANASEYSFHPHVTQQMTTSYTGGVAIRYIEETLFGLQVEMLLTQRGYSDFYEEAPDLHFERQLNYIEVPVMAHVYFPIGAHNEIAFDAGPKLGFFLSDKTDSNLPDDFGIKGEFAGYTYLHHTLPISRKFDYGIQAGLGYEFKFNRKMSLMIQGRYYYGLANLWPDSKADHFEQSSNQSIQVVMSLWWHHVIRGKKVKR